MNYFYQLKKFIIAMTILTSFDAIAAGWVDSFSNNVASKSISISGWACDPGKPGASGWIHIYADRIFIGALPAYSQRGDLNTVCNGSIAHGFSGAINLPAQLTEAPQKKVKLYIGLVLDGDQGVVDDIGNLPSFRVGVPPVYWTPKRIYLSPCEPSYPPSGYGWVYERNHAQVICTSTGMVYRGIPMEWAFLDDPAAPIGATLTICDARGLPNGWVYRYQSFAQRCGYANEAPSFLIEKIN